MFENTGFLHAWDLLPLLFPNTAREKKKRVPKLCSNVVNLLLVLQDLLAVSFKQQGGHTQVVGVEALELVIEAVDSWKGGYRWGRSGRTFLLYLSDIKLLQTIQERSENGRHLRLQCVTCDTRQESERSLRNRVFFQNTFVTASVCILQCSTKAKEQYLFGGFKQKEEI